MQNIILEVNFELSLRYLTVEQFTWCIDSMIHLAIIMWLKWWKVWKMNFFISRWTELYFIQSSPVTFNLKGFFNFCAGHRSICLKLETFVYSLFLMKWISNHKYKKFVVCYSIQYISLSRVSNTTKLLVLNLVIHFTSWVSSSTWDSGHSGF